MEGFGAFVLVLLRCVLTGAFFVGTLRYIEQRKIFRKKARFVIIPVSGWLIGLLSDGMLYGVAGLSHHPLAEALAGLALAALTASVVSAVGCRKKSRKDRRPDCKKGPRIEVRRHPMERVA